MPNSNKLTKDTAITLVRAILRDSPIHNEIKNSFEFSDDEILVALNMAVDDWNTTPPPIYAMDLAKDKFYVPNWLIDMTVIRCLEMLINKNIANHVAYSDGGGQFEEYDKAPMYQAIIDRNLPRLEQKKKELKYSMNIGLVTGAIVSSEFTVWTFSSLAPGVRAF